jgi:hypothetical protein
VKGFSSEGQQIGIRSAPETAEIAHLPVHRPYKGVDTFVIAVTQRGNCFRDPFRI